MWQKIEAAVWLMIDLHVFASEAAFVDQNWNDIFKFENYTKSRRYIVRVDSFDNKYLAKSFFCWPGHLKMSFYYPSSHKGRGGSILIVH